MTQKTKFQIVGVALLLLLAMASVPLLWRMVVPQPYRMQSGHMTPSFPPGSLIFVKEGFYKEPADIKRGDVIIFKRTDEETGQPTDFVTRVVGLPGDAIAMSGTTIQINGQTLPHSATQSVQAAPPLTIYNETNNGATYRVQYGDGPEPGAPFQGEVPAQGFFCLGDNRDNSHDSRYTGSVPFGDIVGKRLAR